MTQVTTASSNGTAATAAELPVVDAQPTKGKTKADTKGGLTISAPDIRTIKIPIIGTAPLMINKFSAKAAAMMQAAQEAGSASKSKKNREAKDFEGLCDDARHISKEGFDGFHAAAMRNGAISACRAAGFQMTKAKLAIFTVPDGFDRDDQTPLVRIYGEHKMDISPCKNQTGVIDLRPRPLYFPWKAVVQLRYDAGILTEQDVLNLIARVGMQVGIGEGRPDSRQSAGLGYGLFEIASSLAEFEAHGV